MGNTRMAARETIDGHSGKSDRDGTSRHRLLLLLAIPLLLGVISTLLAYVLRHSNDEVAKVAPSPVVAPFTADQAGEHQRELAEYLGVDVVRSNEVGMQMVLIPAGRFMMGSTPEEQRASLATVSGEDSWWARFVASETPQHAVVQSKPYRISAHPVTVGQFRAFVSDTGYRTVAETDGKGGVGRTPDREAHQMVEWTWRMPSYKTEEDHPVTQVTWADANAFCRWLTDTDGVRYHLPHEAQWEFACRAGSETTWAFGEEQAKLANHAWYARDGGYSTKRVGRKHPNAFGLFDMHGHVWEWCLDHYERNYYDVAPSIDPFCESTVGPRTLRGGSFDDPAGTTRSAMRGGYPEDYRWDTVGFRVVSELEIP